jgi:hypothetical protein
LAEKPTPRRRLEKLCQAKYQHQKRNSRKKRLQGIGLYKKDKKEYDKAHERNKNKNCLMAWTVNDLKAIVKMEKTKDDGPMPNNKKGIINLYAKCMERKGKTVVIKTPSGSNVTVGNEAHVTTQNDSIKTAI